MDIDLNAYKTFFSLNDAQFTLIEHEDAIVSIVYKIETSDNKLLILKISPRKEQISREAYALKCFSSLLPVPKVIKIMPPSTLMPGAVLMTFIPGEILKTSEVTPTIAFSAGICLAKVHTYRTTGFCDSIESNQIEPSATLYFKEKFLKSLDECHEILSKSLYSQLKRYLRDQHKVLSQVDGPCIIHRDYRPGNILIQDGQLKAVIDWAASRSSFAEEDFCPLEFNEWPDNPIIKTSFLDGYKTIRNVPDYGKIMPLLKLHRSLATIGFLIRKNTWTETTKQLFDAKFNHIKQFFSH